MKFTIFLDKHTIMMEEADIHNIIKEEVKEEELETILPDMNTDIKEEYIEDESECTEACVRTTETEEIFLNEPDCEQFIDEVFYYKPYVMDECIYIRCKWQFQDYKFIDSCSV